MSEFTQIADSNYYYTRNERSNRRRIIYRMSDKDIPIKDPDPYGNIPHNWYYVYVSPLNALILRNAIVEKGGIIYKKEQIIERIKNADVGAPDGLAVFIVNGEIGIEIPHNLLLLSKVGDGEFKKATLFDDYVYVNRAMLIHLASVFFKNGKSAMLERYEQHISMKGKAEAR